MHCYSNVLLLIGLCKDILLPHWDAVSPSHQTVVSKVLSWPAEYCFPGQCLCLSVRWSVCLCMYVVGCVCICIDIYVCVCVVCVCMYVYV